MSAGPGDNINNLTHLANLALARKYGRKDFDRFGINWSDVTAVARGERLDEMRELELARVLLSMQHEHEIDQAVIKMGKIPDADNLDFADPQTYSTLLSFPENFSRNYRGRAGKALLRFLNRNNISPNELASKYGIDIKDIDTLAGWSIFLDDRGDATLPTELDESLELFTDSDALTRPDEDSEDPNIEESEFLALGTYTRRKATPEESCLGANKVAQVLSKFICNSVDEFCMAIFGGWGQGKTFLMERIRDILENEYAYRVVWFNAWKYRSTPELWAHLYQCFVSQFTSPAGTDGSSPSRFVKFALAIRASLYRDGYWAITFAVWSSLIVVLPLAILLNTLIVLISLIGIGWLAYFLHMRRASDTAVNKLLLRFGRLADHTSRLGAQAAIGEDLKSLLVAQMPKGALGNVSGLIAKVILLAAVPGIASILLLKMAANPEGWGYLEEIRELLQGNLYQYVAISLAVWAAAIGSALLLTCFLPAKCTKVLLVVDDLDRCNAAQMLEVIESIKLLLEDEEIQKRVQVVMLIQENHLRDSIEYKFGSISDKSQQSTVTKPLKTREYVVDEHLEKLFVAYYRFGGLDASGVSELVQTYITTDQRHALERLRYLLAEMSDIDMATLDANRLKSEILFAEIQLNSTVKTTSTIWSEVEKSRAAAADDQLPPPVSQVQYEVASYTWEEKEELMQVLETIASGVNENDQHCGRAISPRYIRSFLAKYQLLRLLLASAQCKANPRTVIQVLSNIARHKEMDRDMENLDSDDWEGLPRLAQEIIKQVV
jgi:hypothetical protein